MDPGQAPDAARALATEIARFPQQCLRGDRLSAIEQQGKDEADALAGEFAHGLSSLTYAADGVARFRTGAGRHGAFE